MFDLDGGFTQGFTQEQVDGEFEANGMEQTHFYFIFLYLLLLSIYYNRASSFFRFY